MKQRSKRRASVLAAVFLTIALALSPRAFAAHAASAAGQVTSAVTLAMTQQGDADASMPAQGEEVLPMSMRPLYHVYAAFGLAWLLIFGYAVSLRRRMSALDREVEQLGV